ncbi:uncharacterized protein LOC125551250 isoform X3 [Triticum urartu]|uniref:uncharacterized protein LOC125551250 isoform X3 n=1 Tax=Triticum urartu TaxID=4572 RepID=UPI0020446A54|nr:uncharacterized protein LOC125551250 isoform X3 [Triticum urartu]XP_048570372.1 uncharacterized protein LOC125551250 isoform X3 [Triticum urartu]
MKQKHTHSSRASLPARRPPPSTPRRLPPSQRAGRLPPRRVGSLPPRRLPPPLRRRPPSTPAPPSSPRRPPRRRDPPLPRVPPRRRAPPPPACTSSPPGAAPPKRTSSPPGAAPPERASSPPGATPPPRSFWPPSVAPPPRSFSPLGATPFSPPDADPSLPSGVRRWELAPSTIVSMCRHVVSHGRYWPPSPAGFDHPLLFTSATRGRSPPPPVPVQHRPHNLACQGRPCLPHVKLQQRLSSIQYRRKIELGVNDLELVQPTFVVLLHCVHVRYCKHSCVACMLWTMCFLLLCSISRFSKLTGSMIELCIAQYMYYYWECSEIRTQRSIDSTITVYSRSRVLLLHHLVSSVQQKPQNQFRSREIVSLVGLGIMNGFSSISHSGQVPDVVSDGSTRMSGRQIVQVGRNPMCMFFGAPSIAGNDACLRLPRVIRQGCVILR